jgi:hypothetical protein
MSFTDKQIEQLRPFVAKITDKHNVSRRYVLHILNGTRKVNSEKSKAIDEDFNKTLSLIKLMD